MPFTSPHPLESRRAVEALLHQPGLAMVEIARRTGISYATVKLWNQRARIRPWTHEAHRESDPRTWTLGRMRAVSRLIGRGDIDPGDLAEALGCRRGDARTVMIACGLAASAPPALLTVPGEVPDLAALDAVLRAHIARQIADFDARLNGADPAADTAKVLRDLGGLKRLLDDLSAGANRPDCDGDADGEPRHDLAALREALARRFEAFEAGGHDAGVPAGPAAGADGGAGA